MAGEDSLARLVAAVQSSAKYANFSEDLIRGIGAQELAHRGSLKEAVKATKNKLHQVSGAYVGPRMDLRSMTARLAVQDLTQDNPEGRDMLLGWMALHASTRERLPILEDFFKQTLSKLTPIRSVLDLACGFNPLALPWMPLAPDAPYYGCEVDREVVAFLNQTLTAFQRRGKIETCDLFTHIPQHRVHLAMALKTIPCLEQLDKSIGLRLLDGLQAEFLLVSFPVASLGGRDKGMLAHYTDHFTGLLASRNWPYEIFEFSTELAFLIHKQPGAANA